jgi:prevent-host-death family protein
MVLCGKNITDHCYDQESVMKRVNLADAKARLRELVTRAAAGEPVCIMRRGTPVAQLTAVDVPRKRIGPSALRAITDTMPMQPERARIRSPSARR